MYSALDSITIDAILRRNINPARCTYLGCFPADKLPVPTTYPSCLVVNSDISTEAGTHWSCMYFKDFDTLEYFCPLAYTFYVNPYFIYYVYETLKCRDIYFNVKQVQSSSGKACGYFCIEFLVKRSEGISFSTFMNNYTSSKMYNDLESETFVRDLK